MSKTKPADNKPADIRRLSLLTAPQAAEYLGMKLATFSQYRHLYPLAPDGVVKSGKQGRPAFKYKKATLREWTEAIQTEREQRKEQRKAMVAASTQAAE